MQESVEKTSMVLTRTRLAEALAELGVSAGDVLLVHSSLKAIGPAEGGADGLIDALLEAIGPRGLLAVPTHTWAVVNDKQPVWHELYTPSHVGVLTNVLRRRPGAVRSLHSSHSVAAIGPRAAEFCEGHERDSTPCSPTSPYGRLLEWNGKVLLIGVDLTCCTYFHCLEEIAGLGEIWSLDPVARERYLIDVSGRVIRTTIRGHKDYKSDNYGRLEAELTSAGVIRRTALGNSSMMVVDARAAADYLVPRFRANPYLCWDQDPNPKSQIANRKSSNA